MNAGNLRLRVRRGESQTALARHADKDVRFVGKYGFGTLGNGDDVDQRVSFFLRQLDAYRVFAEFPRDFDFIPVPSPDDEFAHCH